MGNIAEFTRVLTKTIPQEIHDVAVAELNAQAKDLALAMVSAAPTSGEDILKNSVRVDPGRKDTTVIIKAGGVSTTVSGYDYARAVEFGTQKMAAEPFFFNTYNAKKAAIKQAMRDKIKPIIGKYSAK